MNVLVFLFVAVAAFILAGRFYGRYVARNLGIDPQRPTPAQVVNDGRDYVPTKRYVVFAHHFSAIAGAGPIVGPTMAFLYGFIPAWLWVILGGIFIGAVHDISTLFVSMREGGKSMAEIARRTLGTWGFNLFILFTILMLILVNAAFLGLTAKSLTSVRPLESIGATPETTFLTTYTQDGVVYGRIGGVASTSVIIITLLSPILGFLLHRKGIKTVPAYLLASAVCIGSIIVGIHLPVALDATLWMYIISVYVLFAAGLPVWLILQPRDFINVQILYAGIVLMLGSIFITGFGGATVPAPEFANLSEGMSRLGFIWPMMFITVACGAISGFHSLVSGGTTVKQVSSEEDARKIGYNAMLLESLLAVCVLITLAVGLSYGEYKSIVWPETANADNPILGFSLAAGHLFNQAFSIPVDLGAILGILLLEGFVVTTLDASVRLNRYLFEELWSILFANPPALLKSFWFNSGLSVVLMLGLALTNGVGAIWPIFGAGNQLLAALALLAVTGWLMLKGRKYYYVLLPAGFMVVTTIASLLILLRGFYEKGNYLLVLVDILLLCLSGGVVALVVQKILRPGLQAPGTAPVGPVANGRT
jgi:carbon starvation protein